MMRSTRHEPAAPCCGTGVAALGADARHAIDTCARRVSPMATSTSTSHPRRRRCRPQLPRLHRGLEGKAWHRFRTRLLSRRVGPCRLRDLHGQGRTRRLQPDLRQHGPRGAELGGAGPDFDIDDYFYFGRVDTDPCCLFVGAESPLQSIDDIIEEGKTRTLSVGTSRLAHPASIGLLALGEETGANFNLIPLSGGRNTVAGAVTGEVDFSVLTSGSVIASGQRQPASGFRRKPCRRGAQQRPRINDAFDMNLPEMLSARAFGIHRGGRGVSRTVRLLVDLPRDLRGPRLDGGYVASAGRRNTSTRATWRTVREFVEAMLELGRGTSPADRR